MVSIFDLAAAIETLYETQNLSEVKFGQKLKFKPVMYRFKERISFIPKCNNTMCGWTFDFTTVKTTKNVKASRRPQSLNGIILG